MLSRSRIGLMAAAGLVAALGACALFESPRQDVSLRIVALNDFHGHLKTPSPIRVTDPADPSKLVQVQAGGVAYLASAISAAKAGKAHNVVVGAGDLISGSPLVSSLFYDEPAVEVLGEAGLEIASVGNHEFDRGRAELMRLVKGGCRADGCATGQPWTGARFKYLGANVIDEATGKPFLPAYEVRRFGGVPVAFIGLTLQATPQVVTKAGIAGLKFIDEAQAVNALVPELKRQGIEAIVVLIHEGGVTSGGYNDKTCPGLQGAIVNVVKRFDPAVDLVVSGHTHRAYLCRIEGRLTTSAGDYGRYVTEIDLILDGATGDVKAAEANNVVVDTAKFVPNPQLAALVEKYDALAAPKANRVVGYLAGEIPPLPNQAGESALGNVIADAQLAASRVAGAQIAFMNPGGIRAPLFSRRPDNGVTYSDIFTVQPFGNTLVTMSLTGAQLKALLEQQFPRDPSARQRVMQVSKGFTYTWDASQPAGSKVVAGSLRLDGKPIEMDQRYRVTVNSFMADGGDAFSVLRDGTEREGGMLDLDAFEQFLKGAATQSQPLKAAPLERIRRMN